MKADLGKAGDGRAEGSVFTSIVDLVVSGNSALANNLDGSGSVGPIIAQRTRFLDLKLGTLIVGLLIQENLALGGSRLGGGLGLGGRLGGGLSGGSQSPVLPTSAPSSGDGDSVDTLTTVPLVVVDVSDANITLRIGRSDIELLPSLAPGSDGRL